MKIIESFPSIEYFILISRGPLYITSVGFGIEKDFPVVWQLKYLDKNQINNLSNKEAFIKGYTEIINFLESKNKKVIFAIDNPELGIDPTICLQRSINIFSKKVFDCSYSINLLNERNKEYHEAINEIKEKFPNLLVYDSTLVLCDNIKCYGKIGKDILYEDDDHLNVIGSNLLGKDFKKWFDNIAKH